MRHAFARLRETVAPIRCGIRGCVFGPVKHPRGHARESAGGLSITQGVAEAATAAEHSTVLHDASTCAEMFTSTLSLFQRGKNSGALVLRKAFSALIALGRLPAIV